MRINNDTTLCQALANTPHDKLSKIVKNMSVNERKAVMAALDSLKVQIMYGADSNKTISDGDLALIVKKIHQHDSKNVSSRINRFKNGLDKIFHSKSHISSKNIFDSLALINSKSPLFHGVHDIERKETSKLSKTKLMQEMKKTNFETFSFEYEKKKYTFERSEKTIENRGAEGDQNVYWCRIIAHPDEKDKKIESKEYFFGVNEENNEIVVKDEDWKNNPCDLLEAACKAYSEQAINRHIGSTPLVP